MAFIILVTMNVVQAADEPTTRTPVEMDRPHLVGDKSDKVLPHPDDPKKANATDNKTPNSGGDYTGDKLVLQSNVHGLLVLKNKKEGTNPSLALRGTELLVTYDSPDNDIITVVVVSVPCSIKVDDATGKVSSKNSRTFGMGALIDCPTSEKKDQIDSLVLLHETYTVSKKKLMELGVNRSGWVYGALLVPFKYHFDDKSFSSASTIGPYLGYSMGGFGFDTAFVVSIGLSSLVVANENGSGDTSTLQGFSYAVGFIGSANKNNDPVHFGVLVGVDRAGSNSTVPYKHEGEPWVAVQIGFNFTK